MIGMSLRSIRSDIDIALSTFGDLINQSPTSKIVDRTHLLQAKLGRGGELPCLRKLFRCAAVGSSNRTCCCSTSARTCRMIALQRRAPGLTISSFCHNQGSSSLNRLLGRVICRPPTCSDLGIQLIWHENCDRPLGRLELHLEGLGALSQRLLPSGHEVTPGNVLYPALGDQPRSMSLYVCFLF